MNTYHLKQFFLTIYSSKYKPMKMPQMITLNVNNENAPNVKNHHITLNQIIITIEMRVNIHIQQVQGPNERMIEPKQYLILWLKATSSCS